MIGAKISDIRKKRGYTLSELAKRAGISKSYLSNIERNLNRNPSIHVIKKLSLVLDVDLEILLKPETYAVEQKQLDQDWIDLASQLKESGIEKEQLQEYKTLIEFIKWQKQNIDTKEKH